MSKMKRVNFNLSPKTFTRDEWLTPFDRLFDELMGTVYPEATQSSLIGSDFFSKGSYPKVNVLDLPDKVVLEAAVPGLAKADVNVEVTDNVLTISGGKSNSEGTAKSEPVYLRREIKRSSFKRSFALGDNLNVQNISGSYDSGVLILSIPKITPENKSPVRRKIEIS